MKKLLYTFYLFFIFSATKAQTNDLSLYFFLKSSFPDSTSNTASCPWNKGFSVSPPVKWIPKAPQWNNKEFKKEGYCDINTPNSQIHEFDILITGKKISGYSQLQLSAILPLKDSMPIPTPQLNELLGDSAYTEKLLNSNTHGIFQYYYYELKMPGKKTVWVIIYSGTGASRKDVIPTLEMVCFFNYLDFNNYLSK